MRKRVRLVLSMAVGVLLLVPTGGVGVPIAPGHRVGDDVADTPVEAHQHGGAEGHLPGSSSNVQLVGKLTMSDAAPGRIADVFGFGNYAYLGAYWEPSCQRGGVYVIDISNPAEPKEVSFIETPGGTYVSEGVQVIHVDTPKFNGDVLVHNNEICGQSGVGGISLWDVTNPRQPMALARGVGDFTNADGSVSRTAHQVHSAFAWDAGERAYAIMVDDEEALDVDIMDITDPRNPVLIKETGLPDWPGAQDAQSAGMGGFSASFFHDLQVRQFGSKWLALLSYWDAGWVVLDVTNPSNPVFVKDSDYRDPDAVTGFSPPEGNAHQAWWSADGRFFIGTDEDFDPFRLTAVITAAPFAGQSFTATQGSNVPQIDDVTSLDGPTVFVGRACRKSPPPGATGAGQIAVIERGTCTFTEKASRVSAAGYAGGIVFNSTSGSPPCEALVSMLVSGDKPFLFVARSTGFKILGIEGYNPANCPTGTNPPLPSPGTAGLSVSVTGEFDGWGYARLIDANRMREIDQFTIPETLDRDFAYGFGDLSVHEVETDDTQNLAYFSWYAGGLRVARFGRSGIEEVGRYIDANGNNFWGIDPHTLPGWGTLILASDRDSGLWIFRYTEP